jgi:hypothetical protein
MSTSAGETPFTVDGDQYVARWALADNLITVHVDGFDRSKATQVNGANPAWLAKDLGRSIVRMGRNAA